jgi:hypothetical protein
MPEAGRDRGKPDEEPETERERRLGNLVLIGFVVVIIATALWLGQALIDARRADECMSSGRRNCTPVPANSR